MTSWLNLGAIAVAGAIGSLCRYGITLAAAGIPGGSGLWGTTIANLIGCAAIGGLLAWGDAESVLSERMVLALRVGFLGSLTTFSTFASESAGLAQDGRWGSSSLYVGANLILGWAVFVIVSQVVKGSLG